jgi:hypothetical protein
LFRQKSNKETPVKSDTSSLSAQAPGAAPAHANQFALLSQRRFAPFFWTQFSGRGQ